MKTFLLTTLWIFTSLVAFCGYVFMVYALEVLFNCVSVACVLKLLSVVIVPLIVALLFVIIKPIREN